MNVCIEQQWKNVLANEFTKPYFLELTTFVRQEYNTHTCYPPAKLLFNAFNLCAYNDVKVVIVGQDPYHEPQQACGLSFSVNDNVPFPPSLTNIFKEVCADTGVEMPTSGNLERWAKQGVLLLNATLTVREHEAGSHQKRGWETFTDAAIQALNNREHIVFLLWGAYARSKKKLINTEKHLVLECVHPSPLSANRGGWFGNKHFSKANAYLKEHNIHPINW